LAYEICEQVVERPDFSNISRAAAGIDLGLLQTVGQVTTRSLSVISVIVFDGQDVVDLPTESLQRVDGGIAVPDKVFLPVYCGPKFIGPNDSFSTKASQEYIKHSETNTVKKIHPSVNAPFDSVSNPLCPFKGQAPHRMVDVASNVIEADGQFISYVACKKPYYRDVIYLQTGAIAQGQALANSLIISTPAPYGESRVMIFRYAFVDGQWKLSETFGVLPPNIERTPAAAITSQADEIQDFLDSQRGPDGVSGKDFHFVYNISETGPELSQSFPPVPLKKAYTTVYAKAKMATGPLHDASFIAVIVPNAENDRFNQTRLQIKSMFGLSDVGSQNKIVTNRVYQGPAFVADYGPNTRIGLEYAAHNFYNTKVFGQSNTAILVSTKPASQGMSAFYDPCMSVSVLVRGENGTVANRIFDDKQWTCSKVKLTDSKLKSFELGEIVQRTAGAAAMHPVYSPIDTTGIGGAQGTVSIGADVLPTCLVVNTVPGETNAVVELYSGAGGQTPSFEMAIPTSSAKSSPARTLPIPAVKFGGFNIQNAKGSSIGKILGCKTADFLAKPTEVPAIDPPTTLDTYVDKQLLRLEVQSFPLQTGSVSGSAMHTRGHAFIAYECNGRIDMGFRPSTSNTFFPIRDVVLRLPEGMTQENAKDFGGASPDAKMPCLLTTRGINSVLLFYEYKDRVMMKNIPVEIFTTKKTYSAQNKYDISTEMLIAKEIQSIVPDIAYDGNLENGMTGMETDIKLNAVKGNPPQHAWNGNSAAIKSISACRCKDGTLYLFVGDGYRIRVKKSNDNGGTWTEALTEDFFFLPRKKDDKGVEDGEMPTCFYDTGKEDIFLFYIFDNKLVYHRFPEQIFRRNPAQSVEALVKIKPQMVYGDLNEDGSTPDTLTERGIEVQSTVVKRKKTDKTISERILPHQVAIVRPDGGHLRVFFEDDQKRLRSLLSTDGGTLWQNEDQFMTSRKVS
jgi:hypothetical protein